MKRRDEEPRIVRPEKPLDTRAEIAADDAYVNRQPSSTIEKPNIKAVNEYLESYSNKHRK